MLRGDGRFNRVLGHLHLAVHWQFGILIFGSVFGRFSAKLGPKTPLERRGSSCSAGCTKNQLRRPILRPFRGLAAHWHSRILGFQSFGLGPETLRIRPRRAGFQPPGPGETLVLPWRGRRFQPRVGRPGGGPVLAPLGCPGESSKSVAILAQAIFCALCFRTGLQGFDAMATGGGLGFGRPGAAH